MTDNKVVMQWAQELGKQAFTEARTGNLNTLNRLSSNPALKLFLDNVVGTGNVKAEQFAAYYPNQWSEIVRVYEEVQKAENVSAAVDKVATLETKIDKLESMLSAFIESQKPAAVESTEEPKPAKRGKQSAKEVVETEAVEESEAETPEAAESEA